MMPVEPETLRIRQWRGQDEEIARRIEEQAAEDVAKLSRAGGTAVTGKKPCPQSDVYQRW